MDGEATIMSKTLPVNNCIQCRFLKTYALSGEYGEYNLINLYTCTCANPEYVIAELYETDSIAIPIWCPLEDI